ncbi:MAG TPA: ComEC/Rec2 family competence protein [Verrucomicrobiae bacterium]|nr:ComEC/Rec2 family competence protein [Verrucomicrobiae bacterium]
MPLARILCFVFLLGVAVQTLGEHGFRPVTPKDFGYQHGASQDPFAAWRGRVTNRIHILFPGDAGELLAGMLYGERGLSNKSKQAFRQAGLTHLVAVSGSNVSIILVGLSRLLALLGLKRRNAFLVLTAGLVLFVLFVTPQAPVVRAAIMGWLVALAPLVGRIPKTSHLLLVSAVLFTAWKPESLLYDPSFALSFLATLGLMTYGSRFSTMMKGKLPDMLVETVAATLGATLLTTPYAMWAFGQASAIGLLANVFAVPLVPWIMGIGALALLLPFPPFLLAAKGFLDATLIIADASTHLPGYWGELHVSGSFVVISYVCLAAIWFFFKQQRTYPQKNVGAGECVSRA